ncbi:MAG: Gfo/Idh/MocA family oxidoreductase [Capsulimonadaceae bacterium]|nr:Gfo/Idh/MocA family oxidoreductase [Capsulimonadaceae bacterium]
MSTRPIGIGFIGAGAIAQNHHLPVYQKLRDEGLVDILALADVNDASVQATAERFKVPRTFHDYRDLLALDDLDAVVVCTPNYLHKQPAIDAFAAGKHVFVEKPIALDAIEGAAMVDAAHQAGKKLQVGYCMRFSTGATAVKRMVDDGKLGEIYHARCHALRRRGIPSWGVFTQKDKQGGGPLIDIGVHILDLTLWLMGHPEPASVSGQTFVKFGNREGVVGLLGQWDPKKFTVEDYAVGLIRFKSGATIVLESSFAANIAKDEFYTQLVGTEGGAYLNPRDIAETRLYREESGMLTDTTQFGLKPNVWHEGEIRSFIDAIASGKPSPVPGEEGLVVARILDALYESSETGKEVYL